MAPLLDGCVIFWVRRGKKVAPLFYIFLLWAAVAVLHGTGRQVDAADVACIGGVTASFEVVALVRDVDVDSGEASILLDPAFNPNKLPVHKAMLRIKAHGESCKLDGKSNGLWTVIGTKDDPQTDTLNTCLVGTAQSGDCAPFGPVSIDMLFDPLTFTTWAVGYNVATPSIPSFDYVHYWRDKDVKDIKDDREGHFGGTCIAFTEPNSASLYESCEFAPPYPFTQCVSDCSVLDNDDLETCSDVKNSYGVRPVFLDYWVGTYVREDDDANFVTCNDIEPCNSSHSSRVFRAIEPDHVSTPKNFYTMFWDPASADWSGADPLFAQSPEYVCDPRSNVCHFNLFKSADSEGSHVPLDVAGQPDPMTKQWVDRASTTCIVPPPAGQKGNRYLDPELYMDIVLQGVSDTEHDRIENNGGTWQLGNPGYSEKGDEFRAPTCIYCVGDDVNCMEGAGETTASMHGRRHFLWETGPYSFMFITSSKTPTPSWGLEALFSNLGGDQISVDLDEDSESVSGDSRVGLVDYAEQNMAVHISAAEGSNISGLGAEIRGIVITSSAIDSNGKLDRSAVNVWQSSEDAGSPYIKLWDDGCPGCTPLQQTGPGEKRALWYTVTQDMIEKGFDHSNRCLGRGGGSFDNLARTSSCWCEPFDDDDDNDDDDDDVTQVENFDIFYNSCVAGDAQFCRPSNDDGVYSPCYVAVAFDQFYADVQLWKAAGSVLDDRPVWVNYEARRFLPSIYDPFSHNSSPNMWLVINQESQRPAVVWAPSPVMTDSSANPHYQEPYNIDVTFYVTDEFAEVGSPWADADLTYKAPQSDCPYSIFDDANTITKDSDCVTSCPGDTDLLNVSSAGPRLICTSTDPDKEHCGYASFFIDKDVGTEKTTYFLDYSSCAKLGLGHSYEKGSPYTSTGDKTAIVIPRASEDLWPRRDEPFVVFFFLRPGFDPIGPSDTCDVALVQLIGGVEYPRGVALKIPSVATNSRKVSSGVCISRKDAQYNEQALQEPSYFDAPYSFSDPARPDTSTSFNEGDDGPDDPDDVGGQVGSCDFFDFACQIDSGVPILQTDLALFILFIIGLVSFVGIFVIVAWKVLKKRRKKKKKLLEEEPEEETEMEHEEEIEHEAGVEYEDMR